MGDTPHFLTRLQLDHDADARAIRRAYARELKQIDQEQDPAAFQLLRNAYEVALLWDAHRSDDRDHESERQQSAQAPGTISEQLAAPSSHADGAPSPAAMPASGADSQQFDDPHALAQQVFEQFTLACTALSKGRMLHDQALWAAEISRRLNDERLLNIMARTLFEARIAHLLACGWQHGHETLFPAAASVFDWSGDRRRLMQFGAVGARINQAIEERAMFLAQAPEERQAQLDLLRRLGKPVPLNRLQFKRDLACLERMIERFPHWLALTVDAGDVEKWRGAQRKGPGAKHAGKPAAAAAAAPVVDNAPEPQLELGSKWRLYLGAAVIIAALMALNVIRHAFDHITVRVPSERPVPTAQADWRGGSGKGIALAPDEVNVGSGQVSAAPIRVNLPRLSQEQLNELALRIHYTAPPGSEPGVKWVQLAVTLDAQGVVQRVDTLLASGLPDLDATVIEAVVTSKPFPASTPRHFSLTYWYSPAAASASASADASTRHKRRQPGSAGSAPARHDDVPR